MARIPESFECEVCRKRRDNDANHWFMGYRDVDGVTGVRPWKKEIAAEFEFHLCGQDHVIQWMSKMLGFKSSTVALGESGVRPSPEVPVLAPEILKEKA